MDSLEALIKAKIPCPQTGIRVCHTVCAICSPANNCGVNAYVKDGKMVKLEGMEEHPTSKGRMCVKGLSGRQFAYREDRILHPLRRIGERGEGKFEEISWEEAYREIAARLNEIKKESGADAVGFFGGYNKWYRPWLRRLAHSFGTMNFGTESSTCMTAGWMAWKTAAGQLARPDMAHADLYLGWALNPYYSGYGKATAIENRRKNGMKVIIIDPKITPAVERLCDLYLRPYPGTDGALALCMGNILIEQGWIDRAYIEKYVHGFAQYQEYVKGFSGSNIESLTGVPYEKVFEVCRMIHESSSMCINENSAPIPHHKNGFQNYRAIMALTALTGNFDREGGQIPALHSFTHQMAGFVTRDEAFAEETEPKNAKPAVGAERFPLWYYMEKEMQCVDLARQILEEKPYPVRALFAMGMNYRMLPDDKKVREALLKLDFFVDTDLFMTDTAMLADIILPVCTSYERGELETYPGCYAWYTKPAIDRVGESRSDTEIICDLAKELKLGDAELEAGYEKNLDYILRDLDITVKELKASDVPIRVPNVKKAAPGEHLERGLLTPTGKFELYSELIASHPEWHLDSLPTYCEPLDDADPAVYPYRLCSGGRIPNAIHSRLHKVKWARSLRPYPTAELSVEDAEKLGIKEGDDLELFTERGCICVKARPTRKVPKSVVFFYHGYSEADVNSLMSGTHVDPYSGFPAYNSTRCGMRKKVQA